MSMKHLNACLKLAKALRNATVLRLPVEPQPKKWGTTEHPDAWFWEHPQLGVGYMHSDWFSVERSITEHAPFQPGDIVGVREPFYTWGNPNMATGRRTCMYAADTPVQRHFVHPAHDMVDEDIRLYLRITSVRVEQMNVAVVADMWNEMGRPLPHKPERGSSYVRHYISPYARWWSSLCCEDGTLYGERYPFDSEPWTYVYDFERQESK